MSFLINMQAQVCNFIKKETLTQVFSCVFCEISKNASDNYRMIIKMIANIMIVTTVME